MTRPTLDQLPKRVFRYFSSVKLAVPLMIILVVAVALGTVIESRYNADLAKIQIYQSSWFFILLVLLWINIFCATVSRWPYKKHHTGFVITHLGLLTLLIGSLMTLRWGLDGSLRIQEGGASNEVILNDLVVEYRPVGGNSSVVIPLTRSLKSGDTSLLGALNRQTQGRFVFEDYYPFAQGEPGYSKSLRETSGLALKVNLQSQFFDVHEWIHSQDRPVISMGPATLRLITQTAPTPKSAVPQKLPKRQPQSETPSQSQKSDIKPKLQIFNSQTQKLVLEIGLETLRAQKSVKTPDGVSVELVRVFHEAIVGQGGLQEGGTPNKNPALELRISAKGKSTREVAFAKFPDFSLQTDNTSGLKFKYQAQIDDMPSQAAHGVTEGGQVKESSTELPANHPPMGGSPGGSAGMGGNVIEVQVDPAQPDLAQIVLKKNGQIVQTSTARVKETLTTPWMGMKLTVEEILPHAEPTHFVQAIEAPPRTDLPPSALRLRPDGGGPGSDIWLLEGEAQTVESKGQMFEIYFGRRVERLPFEVHLEKFTKTNYPGTQTPMEFESQVRLSGQSSSLRISMNEPIKEQGFTLYQASYIQQPGQPTYSILSVNQDPGRAVKYVGSLVLCLGIAIFTLMRSRIYKPLKKKESS